ncbi:MAG TPA: DUF4192 domain-containing protein [Nocardioides sp.]|nr:DUF4192 domain-containing protein [Nocardioides sp.]
MTDIPPTSLVASTPEDLLAMVPIVIGFAPSESVVMLTFEAAHCFHARVDLPSRADDIADLVEALLEPARRNRVRRVVFVFYADDPGRVARAWRGLRGGCKQAGIDVLEALRVDGRRWFPLLGGDKRVRELGVPYDISAHRFAAQAVVDGRVTHASRDELAALLDADPERAAAVAGLVDSRPDPTDLRDEGEWVDGLVRTNTTAGTSPSDAEVARLLRALVHKRLRDAAWSSLTRTGAQRHVDLWLDVLRRTPTPYTPPVATLLGFAAWQNGHGALAWCAVDRCAEVDPDYTLMTYLASALTHALPPSAWEADFRWDAGLSA